MTTVTIEPSRWWEPTEEHEAVVNLVVFLSGACWCWADSWALINDYPHTVAECACECHEAES